MEFLATGSGLSGLYRFGLGGPYGPYSGLAEAASYAGGESIDGDLDGAFLDGLDLSWKRFRVLLGQADQFVFAVLDDLIDGLVLLRVLHTHAET